MTSQKSRGINARIFASRSTTIASVGVCTRPDRRLEKAAELGIERRHRARAVDAHQPVGLAAADGGVGERLHGFVAAQWREALADGRGRHGLQPEPLDGLLRLRVADDVAENQFAFAPGVAGVDEFGHVVALDEFFEDAQAAFASLNRFEIEVRRDDRQVFESPFALRGLDARRRHDGQQMADRRRDDELVVLEIILMLLKLAERLRDVVGDGRFLRNDECFAHDAADS